MFFLFKLLLTFTATFWMVCIYQVNVKWTFDNIPFWIISIVFFFLPIVLSRFSLFLSKKLRTSDIKECKEINLADNEFLPIYLGYFFLSIGISDKITFFIVYLVVFVFTFLSHTQFFNPIFIFFGYHYYHVKTSFGTKIFLIAKGNVIRNKKEVNFSQLKRLNDSTFIGEII